MGILRKCKWDNAFVWLCHAEGITGHRRVWLEGRAHHDGQTVASVGTQFAPGAMCRQHNQKRQLHRLPTKQLYIAWPMRKRGELVGKAIELLRNQASSKLLVVGSKAAEVASNIKVRTGDIGERAYLWHG